MPRVTLSAARLQRRLGVRLEAERLEELLWASKAQLESHHEDALEVEGTADRLDLLTESGLALHLAGGLGRAKGAPPLLPDPATEVEVEVDASVSPLRPALAALTVAAPEGVSLDDDLLAEAVQFQELLHATLGMGRRLASLGIYPLERVRPPLHYALAPVDRVRFTPLDADGPVGGAEFLAGHPMAQAYGALGRSGEQCLVLRDSAGTILSLPPILNSRDAGEARPGDRRLLLESTGVRSSRVSDAVALLALVFVSNGWHVGRVAVAPLPEGPAPSAPRTLHLGRVMLDGLSGSHLASAEVRSALERARFDVHDVPDGWRVTAAPWRVDLHAPVDVAEDLLLAHGVRAEDGLLPPSATRGARSPAAHLRARVSDLLLGLGFVPLFTPVLVPESAVALTGRSKAVTLGNPVSEQFARMRDAVQTSLLVALGHNVRHGYPQRLSEVGPVVVVSGTAESGAETRDHAGVLLAGEGAGFAQAASVVDYVMRSLGAVGVREPVALPATIAGRSAVLRLAGVQVAEVGEIAPEVLQDLRCPVPVAWAEVDLTALAPLLGGGAGPGPRT